MHARQYLYAVKMETFERESMIRGYHIYKTTWAATVGEELECQRETTNSRDRNAVAVVKNGEIVGHLPRKESHVYQKRRYNKVPCYRYSPDLPQGDLEIPCLLRFKGKEKEIKL